MYLLILYFPLMSFLLIGFFGRFFGSRGSQFLSTFLLFLNFLLSLCIFYEVVLKSTICVIKLFYWFNVGLFQVEWGFLFDPLTATMLIVVNLISFLVHFFSIDYMSADPFISRFMAYLSLFTWFMLMLVTSDNFLQLFFGWEGVGLTSFLLINFWFSIIDANRSALKAMIMNRIGDIGLAAGICLIYLKFKTLEFTVIFSCAFLFKDDYIFFFGHYFHYFTVVVILLLIGAVGKSAQVGLHTWLPDAMAGPTPVSALIHAATMVTAGVFLLIRVSPILEYSEGGLFIITLFGIITAFFSATIGLFQNDLKKIIAYSTCSQLGYMVFICGLSNYSLSLFHLFNHAFFKALLFLSAGSIIHAMLDEQDIRRYGGLNKILPFSYTCMLIGSLSLMGVPFLTGFYSKDIIIEIAYSSYILNNNFIYWLSVITALFTSIYSIRLIFFTFFTKPNGFKVYYKKAHDAPFFMAVPLVILSLLSIFAGFLFKDLFIGLGNDVWFLNDSINNFNLAILESEFLPFYIKNIPIIFSLGGVFVVFIINSIFFNLYVLLKNNNKVVKILFNLYRFFSYKWYIDILYNKIIVVFFFNISYSYIKNIDRGLIEFFGPLGIIRSLNYIKNKFNLIQTGFIYNYLFFFVLAIIFIVLFFFTNLFTFSFDYFFILCILTFIKKWK